MFDLKVKATFTEECLGTAAGDPEIHEGYIASRAPDAASTAEEVEALGVEAVIAKGKTIFPKENGVPFVWDYQIKGHFKGACGALIRIKETLNLGDFGYQSKKNKVAYKKIIDGMIFPNPRKIIMTLPEGGVIGSCQRPIRMGGPKGDVVALANSESTPAGTTIEFNIEMLTDYTDLVKEWLDYGKFVGLLQWRNSGKGRFSYEIIT